MLAGDPRMRRAPLEPDRQAAEGPGSPVKTVLVTGGAGYIGSALVRGLLADGLRVRALDLLLKGDAGIRALYTNPDFELIRGDVRRAEPVVRALHGVDAVIHLAGVAGESACRRDPKAAVESNVAATSLLAEVCRGIGIARLGLASTLDVYGRRERTVDERSDAEPASLFAATKVDAERLVLAAGDGQLHPVVFRLGDVFGVDVHPEYEKGLNRMTSLAWRRGRIIHPRPSAPVYRTHVSDVCAVMRQALVCRAEVVAGEIFNVGCEQMRFTADEVALLLAEAAPQLGPAGSIMAKLPAPAVSFQKLRARFGIACRGSLRQGLAELLVHLRRGGPDAGSRRPAMHSRLPPAELAAARFYHGDEVGRLE